MRPSPIWGPGSSAVQKGARIQNGGSSAVQDGAGQGRWLDPAAVEGDLGSGEDAVAVIRIEEERASEEQQSLREEEERSLRVYGE